MINTVVGFIEYYALSFLFKSLGLLPVAVRSLLGRTLGTIVSWFPTRDKHIAKSQLNVFVPQQGGDKLLSKVYASLGQTALECVNLAPLLKQNSDYMTYNSQENLDAFTTPSRGIIALTAHLGNWDLSAASLISRGAPLVTIGREMRRKSIHRILSDIRADYGIKTIWRKGSDTSEIKDIIKHIKANHVIGALIDQDTRVSGAYSRFFGVPVSTPVTLIKLAKKYNADIVTVFCVRIGFNQYQTYIEPIDCALPVNQILDEYNNRLEQLIRRYPDQWVWMHRRWRTTAEGTRRSSSDYLQFLREISSTSQ